MTLITILLVSGQKEQRWPRTRRKTEGAAPSARARRSDTARGKGALWLAVDHIPLLTARLPVIVHCSSRAAEPPSRFSHPPPLHATADSDLTRANEGRGHRGQPWTRVTSRRHDSPRLEDAQTGPPRRLLVPSDPHLWIPLVRLRCQWSAMREGASQACATVGMHPSGHRPALERARGPADATRSRTCLPHLTACAQHCSCLSSHSRTRLRHTKGSIESFEFLHRLTALSRQPSMRQP